MKYLTVPLLILLSVLAWYCFRPSSPNVDARYDDLPGAEYRVRLQQCDDTADKCDQTSTVGMIECLDAQQECYVKLIHDIYDKYHTDVADIRKADLAKFIELSAGFHYDSFQPDFCRPSCGTIASTGHRMDVIDDLNRYILTLISALPGDEDLQYYQSNQGQI